MSDLIRPEIIARYQADAEQGRKDRHAMIAARDDQFRSLNREFDFADLNGNVTSSYMAEAGPEYHARYRGIDDDFKRRYEGIAARQQVWRKKLEMTLSEFLFLDSFYDDLLKQLCDAPRFNESWRSDLLRRKAAIFVDYCKAKENVGGIYARIKAEMGLFHYTARRSRIFFGVGVLDFGALITMRRYREDWKRALYEVIDDQRLD